MSSRRFARKPPDDLCSALSADDGIDPRLLPRTHGGKVSNRKALQLCRQVERALSVALEGNILGDLTVETVVPGPDSRRLLVTCVQHGPAALDEVLGALQQSYPRLRSAVAEAIHRKRTPELSFQVMLKRA